MSKFQTYEAYLNPNKDYSLLPFKFENLGDEKVVLTNLVGEYEIISKETKKLLPKDIEKIIETFLLHFQDDK